MIEKKSTVIYYLNQFFAGYGGEDKADLPLEVIKGAVGPAKKLEEILNDKITITTTIMCGDNYFQAHTEEVLREIVQIIKKEAPDALIAGPAFNAGRYGLACRATCERVQRELNIPAVTSMYRENPGVAESPINTHILSGSGNVRGMRQDLDALAEFARKIVDGEEIKDALAEGYFPRGRRKNVVSEEKAAARAVKMLKAKIRNEEYTTEIPRPVYDIVEPAEPVKDLAHALIALATDGGVVPQGNPDRLESARATKWFKYGIKALPGLDKKDFMTIHGGFDTKDGNNDPNRIVPVDGMRQLENEGRFGKLYEWFYTTAGANTPVLNAVAIGRAMARDMVEQSIQGVILTGT